MSINFDRDKLTHANSCTCTIQCIMLVIWLSVFALPLVNLLSISYSANQMPLVILRSICYSANQNAIGQITVHNLQCGPKCYWSICGPYFTVRTKMPLVILQSGHMLQRGPKFQKQMFILQHTNFVYLQKKI